jgi:hypothetical protein
MKLLELLIIDRGIDWQVSSHLLIMPKVKGEFHVGGKDRGV